MAVIWNVTDERLALTRGYINPGEQRNVDVTQAAEAALISDRALIVVDPSADPPAPTTKTVPVVTTVAFTDPSGQVTLDIAGEATDAELAAAIAAIGGRFRGPYSGLANGTTVKANDVVTNPSGALVSRIADGTISGSYNSANWTALSAGSGSGLPSTIVSKTTAYTAAAGEFVQADATTAGFTVTLPTAPAAGALVAVKKTDSSAHVVTVAPAGGGSIDGSATAIIVAQYAGAVLEHVGSNVWVVASVMSAAGPAGPAGPTGPQGSNGMQAGVSAGVVGRWYAATAVQATSGLSIQSIPVGTASMGTPLVVQDAMTIDQLACYVQTIGSAGALVRLALYKITAADPYTVTLGSVFAQTLLGDTGTSPTSGAATSIGRVKFTLGSPVTVAAGDAIAIAVAVQGSGGAVGIYHEALSNTWAGPWGSDDVLNGQAACLRATGISGAFPSTFTPSAFATNAVGAPGWFHRSA